MLDCGMMGKRRSQVSEVGIERVVVGLDAQWAYERVDPITAASEYPMLMKTSDAGRQD